MKKNKANIIHSRREFIKNAFAAAGGLGLKSLLLGLPPTFLTSRALAAENLTYLIFSTSMLGDPINANIPGTYAPGFDHGGAFTDPTNLLLGAQTFQAAQAWSTLSANIRGRLNFFHHATQSPSHTEMGIVMQGKGSVIGVSGSGLEMIPSAIAQHTAAGLGTTIEKPIVVGEPLANITYKGVIQSQNRPASLKALSALDADARVNQLIEFRDRHLDSLYADLKNNGTPAQKAFLDKHFRSRNEARQLGNALLELLADVNGNTVNDDIIASLALFASGSAPVSVIRIPFGGDNHNDTNLENEILQTTQAMTHFNNIWNRANTLGLADKLTFANLNVFGRTLKRNANGGRDHNAHHSAMVMFGSKVRPGVTGAIAPRPDRFAGGATAINSVNGSASGTDIPVNETLAAACKTLMKACGIDENTIDQRVHGGKVVQSAVV